MCEDTGPIERPLRVMVTTDNGHSWAGNSLTFNTVAEAKDYGVDLHSRWMSVDNWKVVDAKDRLHFKTDYV